MATPVIRTTISGKVQTQLDGIWVDVEGVEELMAKIRTMHTRVQKKLMNKAGRQAAYVVRDYARRLAPKQTGALRKAIAVRAMKKTTRFQRKYITGASVVVRLPGRKGNKANEYYGAMVEYGTRHMRPQPFLRPALKATEDEVRGVYRAAFKAAIAAEIANPTKIKPRKRKRRA